MSFIWIKKTSDNNNNPIYQTGSLTMTFISTYVYDA